MNPSVPSERPRLRSLLSQEICALECELLDLEKKLMQVEAWLTRKWEIDSRLILLRYQENRLSERPEADIWP